MKSPVVKRSIVLTGHKTSISLEEAFWNGLKDIAMRRRQTLSDLVCSIDAERGPLLRCSVFLRRCSPGEIERRLRVLEKSLEKIGARTSSNARETADGLTEAIASALFGWADRFRQGASSFGDQSTAFGKDAARYGSAALTRVTEETEQRPLLAIAVALGVGILIGMAARGRT